MKNKLLITTALVAVTFVAPVMAGEQQVVSAGANLTISENIKNVDTTEKGKSSGAIFNEGTLQIEDGVEFLENRGQQSAAIYNYNGGNLSVGNNVKFTKNIATKSAGGAIQNFGKATFGDNIEFNNNTAGWGGAAIYAGGNTSNGHSTTIGNNAKFINNTLTAEKSYGGAIFIENDEKAENVTLDVGNNATFENNTAKTEGGAIYIKDKVTTTLGEGATFKQNAAGRGGAIYTLSDLVINNATFEENEATETWGGAIFNGSSVEIDNSKFNKNKAAYGAAVVSALGSELTLSNSEFTENNAEEQGAVAVFGKATLSNVNFIGNTTTFAGGDGAGALFLGAESQTTVNGGLFKDNTSDAEGGAIAMRKVSMADNSAAKLDIFGTTFENNHSKRSGGAIYATFLNSETTKETIHIEGATFNKNEAENGGAIYVEGAKDKAGNTAALNIKDSVFTENTATSEGGAIYNASKLMLTGTNTFSENKAGENYSDIYNLGTIHVAENSVLTLDGGISGTGTTSFAKNTTLKINTITQMDNTIESAGTTLKVNIDEDVEEIDLTNFLAENVTLAENGLYNLVQKNDEESKIYAVTEKTTAEVASSLGLSITGTTALIAALSKEAAEDSAFEKVQNVLEEAAQDMDKTTVREAEKLGADAAPVARVVETLRSNMVLSAVNDELNGEKGAIAEGMSAGDYFHKTTTWIRGLFNYADKDGTSKAAGFDADTYGVAMGIDKELDNHVKAGVGYAYSQTDVNGDVRDTDVDSHSLFVYGQYKPADWYINTALAYSWSDYEEKKSVLSYSANAKYDVDTIALQSMYGFERKLGEYDLNPEFGFRYMHMDQDGYTDKLGTKVKSKESDVLTLVAGTKIAKEYELENGMTLRPELKAAATYDVVSDDNNTNVMLANGAGYKVRGEKLERLGLELGAKVATNVADNWELSAGYEVRLREDYQDNTLMFNAKYNF